jgi:hypothetical protein
MTVAITRQDVSAADLRLAATRTQDAKAARRMLALALVLEGHSRAEAAQACAMDLLRLPGYFLGVAPLLGLAGGVCLLSLALFLRLTGRFRGLALFLNPPICWVAE